MKKILFIRFMNSFLILVLVGVLLGAFYQQIVHHEIPCPLCRLQRLGMIGVGVGAVMNLRFGFHPQYYAISFFSACMGSIVSIRQILLHICPGFPTFGVPVFGLSLYTWAFVVFCCSILMIVSCLLFYSSKQKISLRMNFFEKFVSVILFFVILANTITTAWKCGLSCCSG